MPSYGSISKQNAKRNAALEDMNCDPMTGRPIRLILLKARQWGGCIMSIGSAQKPDSLRSFDLAMLHLSEVGLWRQTAGKSPEDLIQALIGALSRGKNTILVEIREHYENLFYRTQPVSIADKAPTRMLGFHTGKGSKEMIINRLNAAARDTEYIERSARTCDEMDTYEIKPDGKMGAVEGTKDDLVISTAGGVWLASSYMSLPGLIKPQHRSRKGRVKTEAMI